MIILTSSKLIKNLICLSNLNNYKFNILYIINFNSIFDFKVEKLR